MKKILIIALGLLLLSLAYSKTWANNATLSWHPTSTKVNGTPVTNLAGYKIYYGTAGSTYTQVVNVGPTGSPSAPTYTFTNLAAGKTYYFAVTAYDAAGKESKFSNEVSKTFTNSVTTITTTTTTFKPATSTTVRPIPSTIKTTTTTVKPTTSTTVRPTPSTTTTIPARLPSADSLSITTAPGVTQTFTGTYSDPDGWQYLSDASFYISGGGHDQWLHYNTVTNSFTLVGSVGSCTAGQAATLSNRFLTLNCNASTYSGSGNTLTVTFSLTPQSSFSGYQYRLIIVTDDRNGNRSTKFGGNWTIKLSHGGD